MAIKTQFCKGREGHLSIYICKNLFLLNPDVFFCRYDTNNGSSVKVQPSSCYGSFNSACWQTDRHKSINYRIQFKPIGYGTLNVITLLWKLRLHQQTTPFIKNVGGLLPHFPIHLKIHRVDPLASPFKISKT